MTTLNFEHIAAASKEAVAEAQGLATTAFYGFEKLVELNLATVKSSWFDTSGDFVSIWSAKSPTDALAAHASLVKPLAEKAIAYSRSVQAITTETTTVFSKVIEGRVAEGQKNFTAALELLSKNAPAGSESVVAAIKSAVTAGQTAIESAKKSAREVSELVEKQAASVTESALSAVKTVSRKK